MPGPVHVGRALESLRNSDFNTVSAIGEVIDNSVEAGAKNIHIKIKKIKVRKNAEDLIEVAFADDGKGMSKEILWKCLQLGFSERYNNRKGIGRFGVGMTLGAVTQCTRIEVYSKPAGGGWNFTYLDLDEIKDKEDAEIPEPCSAEVPRDYADAVGDTGTLVIWKNWDREDAKVVEIEEWVGRTYRKFIGSETIQDGKIVKNKNQRHIFLDDGEITKEISAYDPLYVTKTAYNKEVTTLEKPIELEEEIHQFDKPPEKPSGHGKITIRMSLLPEGWRKTRGVGNSKENNARLVYRNEGISILRNGREVFYGHIPFYKIQDKTSSHYGGFIDLDRFWGCEIEFDAVLDHWFSVKNVKVGARPNKDLREKIQELINPTIMDFREEIRRTWKASTDETRKATSGEIGGGTETAESVITGNSPAPTTKPSDIDIMIQKAAKIKEETKKVLVEKLGENPLVFARSYDMDERGNFIDIVHRGGSTILTLNMKHAYFRKFDEAIKHLKEMAKAPDGMSTKKMDEVIDGIDTNGLLLLATFTMAQNELNRSQERLTGDVIDKLIRDWTYELDKQVRTTLDKKQE